MIKQLSAWFALLFSICAGALDTVAHPLGNFSLNHYNILEIQRGGFLSQHVLDFAEIPSFNELSYVDANNDSRVTSDELRDYRERLDERFWPHFAFKLLAADGAEIPLQSRLVDREVILHYGNAGLTCMIVILTAEHRPAPTIPAGEFTLEFEDSVLPHVRGKHEIILTYGDGIERVRVDQLSQIAPGRIHVSSGEPVYEGLRARVTFHSEEPFDVGAPLAAADVFRAIHPASVPQFPLEQEEDGSYRIVRVPVQPQREVQERIALLQPRGATGVDGMLGAMGQIAMDQANNGASEAPAAGRAPAPQQEARSTDGYSEKSDEAWTNLIGAQDLSPMLLLFILGASILFGAAHALSPGHGKTVVAAYLVGSRGTVWHAFFLGIIVTMTHVSSVLMIGVVTLYFSQYIMPDQLYPIMEGASGVLIIMIGAMIFLSRYGAYQRMKAAEAMGVMAGSHQAHARGHSHSHAIAHTHDHDHSHVHKHEHPHSHDASHSHAHDHGDHPSHSHAHSHDLNHDHDHDHKHPHTHDHGHTHHHDHDHNHHHHSVRDWLDHDHSHGPHGHTHEIPADATWRDLLVLGVTGGIVPCPSAVVVLLAAIALKRLALGLVMILFFSIGLATVLILIGILVVKAKSLIDRFGETGRMTRWLQIASPVVVMLLGFVILLRGLQSGGVVVINL